MLNIEATFIIFKTVNIEVLHVNDITQKQTMGEVSGIDYDRIIKNIIIGKSKENPVMQCYGILGF